MRIGAQGGAHPPHPRRGVQAVADDVADDDRHAPVGQREEAAPVAADLVAVVTGEVVRGDLQAGQHAHVGQEAALQRERRLASRLVELGLADRQAHAVGDEVEELQVVLVVGVLPAS